MPKHELKRDHNNRLRESHDFSTLYKTKVNQGVLILDSLPQRKANQLFTNNIEWSTQKVYMQVTLYTLSSLNTFRAYLNTYYICVLILIN